MKLFRVNYWSSEEPIVNKQPVHSRGGLVYEYWLCDECASHYSNLDYVWDASEEDQFWCEFCNVPQARIEQLRLI